MLGNIIPDGIGWVFRLWIWLFGILVIWLFGILGFVFCCYEVGRLGSAGYIAFLFEYK